VLARFRDLRAMVPASFPMDPRHEVTCARMQAYSDVRTSRFFHLLNLPFALYGHGYAPVDDARDLLGSLLSVFDQFCARFARLPGAQSLLSPLWKNLWTDTPEIWSVASCAYLALNYDDALPPVPVLGFERPIGSGPRDADITLKLAGITHFDVEAFHLPTFDGKSDEDIRAALADRAERKAETKFRDLPTGENGVIAVVAVMADADIGRRLVKPGLPVAIAGTSNVRWLPLKLVSVRAPRQQFIIAGL
jgi:hypothetical protein